MKDYYTILEITPTASAEVIKAAYRALAKKYHPDTTKDSTYSEKMMKEVNEAYSVLSDPISRARYDDEYKREQYKRASNNSYENTSSTSDEKKSYTNTESYQQEMETSSDGTKDTGNATYNEKTNEDVPEEKGNNYLFAFCIAIVVIIAIVGIVCSTPLGESVSMQNSRVEWLSERQIWHQDDEERFVLVFSLLDKNKKEMYVPAKVEISIVNESGEEVYRRTKTVVEEDFLEWTYHRDGSVKHQATVYINDNEIKQGNAERGTIYFTVYDEAGAFSFDESELSILSGLPVKPVVVEVDLPCTINSYDYNGNISTKIEIEEMTYEVKYSDSLYMYLSGEKLYDFQGNTADNTCEFEWRLYDSQGYLIESGSHYVWNLKVGDKFKGESIYVFDGIVPGGEYILELEEYKGIGY